MGSSDGAFRPSSSHGGSLFKMARMTAWGCPPLKGSLSRHHLEEQNAERPEIGTGVDVAPPGLFGRHVGRRSHGRTRSGNRSHGHELGQPEIQDLDQAVFGHDHVCGFDVPVDDVFGVDLLEAARNLFGEVHRFVERKGALRELFLERLPFVVGHGDEQPAVLGLVDFVDGADVRMIESRSRLGFDDEALFSLRVVAELGRQELERHDPTELQVRGAIDHTHTAAPELVLDPVMGDFFADHLQPVVFVRRERYRQARW